MVLQACDGKWSGLADGGAFLMLYNISNIELQRDKVLSFIRERGYKRVVDVGGGLGPWACDVVSHYVDLQSREEVLKAGVDNEICKATYLTCDIGNPFTWTEVEKEVHDNGKFDFVICTQTLEHIGSPSIALSFLQKLGDIGFVSVPSKYIELKRGVQFTDEGLRRCKVRSRAGTYGSPWRGFLPHKWICTVRNGGIWFWPKLNFLEYLEELEWADNWPHDVELSFWWAGDIPRFVVPDSFIDHPDPQKACELYRKELEVGL